MADLAPVKSAKVDKNKNEIGQYNYCRYLLIKTGPVFGEHASRHSLRPICRDQLAILSKVYFSLPTDHLIAREISFR